MYYCPHLHICTSGIESPQTKDAHMVATQRTQPRPVSRPDWGVAQGKEDCQYEMYSWGKSLRAESCQGGSVGCLTGVARPSVPCNMLTRVDGRPLRSRHSLASRANLIITLSAEITSHEGEATDPLISSLSRPLNEHRKATRHEQRFCVTAKMYCNVGADTN